MALYRLDGGGGAWAMTERGRARVARSSEMLSIGPSSMSWEGDTLVIRVDEVTAPLPSRLRGVVRVHPEIPMSKAFHLDAAGRHVWRPIAPRARVEAEFSSPSLRWSGPGYLDSNFGGEPLERAFRQWTWARAHHARDVTLLYDAERRDGSRQGHAVRIDSGGRVENVAPPPLAPIARTGWGLRREMWDRGARLRATLEDTPFYARTALVGDVLGAPAEIMHESLSLDRLRSPVVRAMLPFRMPRLVW